MDQAAQGIGTLIVVILLAFGISGLINMAKWLKVRRTRKMEKPEEQVV